MRIILELYWRSLELAGSLDIDQARRGDEDVRDRFITKQRLERPQAEDLVEYFFDQGVLFDKAERSLLLIYQLGDRRPDFLPDAISRHRVHRFEVDSVKKLSVNRKFQLLILRRGGVSSLCSGAGALPSW